MQFVMSENTNPIAKTAKARHGRARSRRVKENFVTFIDVLFPDSTYFYLPYVNTIVNIAPVSHASRITCCMRTGRWCLQMKKLSGDEVEDYDSLMSVRREAQISLSCMVCEDRQRWFCAPKLDAQSGIARPRLRWAPSDRHLQHLVGAYSLQCSFSPDSRARQTRCLGGWRLPSRISRDVDGRIQHAPHGYALSQSGQHGC